MNQLLPPPGTPRRFESSPRLLRRIAIAMGVYLLLVLYPAYAFLAWISADVTPGWRQVAIVAICAAAFSAHAYHQMSKLTRPRRQRLG